MVLSRISKNIHDPVKDQETGIEVRFNRHPHRKNNYVVAAMYQMYLHGNEGKGCSLEEVGKVYRKTRQAVYDVFRSRGFALRSKKLEGLTEIDGISFTYAKGGYLRGTIPGRGRMFAHHYMWEKVNGAVPPGHVIHLKDGNPSNVAIENLELVAKGEMSARFNPQGNNQYTKSHESDTMKTVAGSVDATNAHDGTRGRSSRGRKAVCRTDKGESRREITSNAQVHE